MSTLSAPSKLRAFLRDVDFPGMYKITYIITISIIFYLLIHLYLNACNVASKTD